MTTVKPLNNRVVVEPIEEEEKTAGGIFLPQTAQQKPQNGKVIAVGPGEISDDGERSPMTVEVGDNVLYAKFSGTEVEVDGKELLIMRETDLLAIIED
ncbi:MAG: co-chaperone GroES [Planctomycetes bacterium]|nr:co-chaperone GroES [Planctomycetota bacterium]